MQRGKGSETWPLSLCIKQPAFVSGRDLELLMLLSLAIGF